MRRWLRRGTLALGVGVALFLMITLVLPLETVGDPVFDAALLRARWYTGWGVLVAHIAATLGMAALAITGGRRGWAIAADVAILGGGLALFAALVLNVSGEARLGVFAGSFVLAAIAGVAIAAKRKTRPEQQNDTQP